VIYQVSRLEVAQKVASVALAELDTVRRELADVLERLELAEFVATQVAREFREYRETHP
jgi:uncharacterized membrane protein YheB (UPF0754 family)